MLQKTLVFDIEVLGILRNSTWRDDGLSVVINGGQIMSDRQLYLKVNKALEAMGGKWSRKDKAHVFATDPRAQVAGLLESGTLTVDRDGFFQTPRKVVERMIDLVPISTTGMTLEPSAGLGAIAAVLIEHGVPEKNIVMVEKNQVRAQVLSFKFENARVKQGDFYYFFEAEKLFDRIYMNPPFEEGQDIAHVMRAYNLLAAGGRLISVMGEGAFFRKDSSAVLFRDWLNTVGGVSEKLPEKSFAESGTGVNTRLVYIQKG